MINKNLTLLKEELSPPLLASSLQNPSISIITVVLNDRDQLEGTIKSIIDQTYENMEYLLIDGGSTDGTLDIINKYKHEIDYFVSEKDKGIYDAFNKGARLAKGEWIIFMNAGDRFYSPHVLSEIFASDCSQYDLIYGNQEINYNERFTTIRRAKTVEKLWKGMHFSHQSTFMRTSCVRQGFNLKNKISADFEMIYHLKNNNGNFLRVDKIIATVRSGGFPDVQRVNSIKSQWKVVSAYGRSLHVNYYYSLQIVKSIIKNIIKNVCHKILLI